MKRRGNRAGKVLLGLAIVLLVGWLLLPNAADASGLTEFAAQGIDKITLYPRYGSGDPEIEITSADDIEEILSWFSSLKLRPTMTRFGGNGLFVVFSSRLGNSMAISVKNYYTQLYISSPQCETMKALWNNYDAFWGQFLP